MVEDYGLNYKAPLLERVRLAWRLVRGQPVAYHIGCHGTGIYIPVPGSVVGCEVRPEGFLPGGLTQVQWEIAGQTEMGGMNG